MEDYRLRNVEYIISQDPNWSILYRSSEIYVRRFQKYYEML